MPSLLTQVAMEGARSIEGELETADADWLPVLLVEANGATSVIDVTHFFTSEKGRHAFAERVLPQIVEDVRPDEIVMVNPVWLVVSDEEIPFFEGLAEGDPDRMESLMVVSLTSQGVEIRLAPVGRDPLGEKPPSLGEFELLHPESTLRALQSEMMGNAIAALQRVHDA